ARLDKGEDPRAVLQQLAHQLANKLMHAPTASLRRANGRDELVRAARELLGLDEPR
ncbi:MAG: glutamyl-tRNA reductase, partial [Gammaproteobacteria bacterium]